MKMYDWRNLSDRPLLDRCGIAYLSTQKGNRASTVYCVVRIKPLFRIKFLYSCDSTTSDGAASLSGLRVNSVRFAIHVSYLLLYNTLKGITNGQ